jgi:iron transport multicopper oxidase
LPSVDPDNVYAVLHYAGAPDADPTTAPGGANGVKLEEYQLHPLDPGAPGGSAPADHVIDLNFGTDKDADDRFEWEINGISYKSPDLPTLLKVLNGARVESDFTPSEHTFVLQRDEIVELHIHGSANGHSQSLLCLL